MHDVETAPAVIPVEAEAVTLGSFGAAREVVPVTAQFTWYGHTIRVNADASDLDLVEFMGAAGDLDDKDPAVIPALTTLLKRYVHPDDWRTFWQAARVNRADVAEDFLPLVNAIAGAVTGRPTERPPASTGGQPPTRPSSTAGSSSPAAAVLQRLATRGDLGMFVVAAEQHRRGGSDPASATV